MLGIFRYGNQFLNLLFRVHFGEWSSDFHPGNIFDDVSGFYNMFIDKAYCCGVEVYGTGCKTRLLFKIKIVLDDARGILGSRIRRRLNIENVYRENRKTVGIENMSAKT